MHTALYGSLVCGLLMIAIADVEDIQHAGHVHTAHEVDGKHNVEFDHEAILGMFSILINSCIISKDVHMTVIY